MKSLNAAHILNEPRQAFVSNKALIVSAFAVVFFPRIFEAVGFPAAINFAHFLITPAICIFILTKSRVKDKAALKISTALVSSLLMLFATMVASTLFGHAGIINLVLGYFFLAEPFLFLATMFCIDQSKENIRYIKKWLLVFAAAHLSLAFAQQALIVAGILKVKSMTLADNVQGVFYLSGGGHVVGASVAMIFGLYFFMSQKNLPFWVRSLAMLSSFMEVIFADAKQVLFIWLVSWVILIIIQSKSLKALSQYVISAILVCTTLFICIENIEALRAYKTWIRPGLYGLDGEVTQLKLNAFRIIPVYYESPLNWLFGLGPGHTVGRLGGWILESYWKLLQPLGATTHPATEAVWSTYRDNWLDSSMFSPLYGWSGIWGDFGVLGLVAYLYLGIVTWRNLCKDDLTKFILISTVLFGFVFTQLEEPGYMLTATAVIGLRFQEQRLQA
jgi:hypothetical protein